MDNEVNICYLGSDFENFLKKFYSIHYLLVFQIRSPFMKKLISIIQFVNARTNINWCFKLQLFLLSAFKKCLDAIGLKSIKNNSTWMQQ